MQHIKLWLRRSVPLILICCVFIFALSPSASAAALPDMEWTDFPFTSTTSGSLVNYTVDFTSGGEYFIVRRSPYQEYPLGSDPYFVIESSGAYSLDYNTPKFEYDPLFFIGANTSYSFSFDFWGGYQSLDFTDSYFYVRYFDSSGSYLGVELIEATRNPSTDIYTAHFVPNVMSGTAYIQFTCTLYFNIQLIVEEDEATPVVFPITSFDYHFSVPVDSALNQQIKDKLDQLSDQQNQTNEKLDGIINGEVSPDPPAGSGLIDDLDQAEGALRDEAQSGLNNALDKFQHAEDSIEYYGQAFAVVANIFGYLTELPFFSLLLDISLSLGVLCVILNLGEMATRVSGARSRRAGKSKKGG